MVNKKGISAIITTILIILLALALIILIWAFFKYNISKSGSQVDASVFTTRLTVPEESVKVNSTDISLVVKRQEGIGTMSAFIIVLEDIKGNKKAFRYNESLQELQTIGKTISYSSGLMNLTKVCVVPFVLNKEGRELQGKQEDCYTISSSGQGIIAPPPVPTINPPANFKASTLSYDSINLTWNDVSNEEGYVLENSGNVNGPYSLLIDLPNNIVSYAHFGLLPLTQQYYHIRAKNASIGESVNASANNQTFQFVVPAGGLIAYYKMEDNTLDSSGNNYHGTFYGGMPIYSSGRNGYGKAIDFDGLDDYAITNSDDLLDTTQSGTIAAWIKTNSSTSGIIIGYGNQIFNWRGHYAWFVSNGNLTIEYQINGVGCWSHFFTDAEVNNGSWHFVVFMADGINKIRVFLDNVEKTVTFNNYPCGSGAQSDWAADSFGVNGDPSHISIGALKRIFPYPEVVFNGTIDEVMIWNRNLSQQEINGLYACQLNNNCG